jgi:hypothetical protein
MLIDRWVRGPIGMDADWRVTRAGCLSVLVTVPTVAAGTRLLELLALLEGDHRVQVLFSIPDSARHWSDATDFVRGLGGLRIPWGQALEHAFDLVLAASHTELASVRGRVLLVPHGASSLMSRRFSRSGGPSARPHMGLARETLTHRGRILPSAIALTHDQELVALRRSCPEALPRAVVTGDICMDRLLASLPQRDDYRQALGVGSDQRLVTVSSTWSTESVFGRHPLLCRKLVDTLPSSQFRVALVLHPSAWAVHSQWQISNWLADCVRMGLLVIPPNEGWQAAAIASDLVIGDFGSTTQYAAALGRPVALAAYPELAVRQGSLAAAVATRAPRLDVDAPLPQQVDRALASNTFRDGAIAELISSRLGRSAELLRRAMYDLLDLPEPSGSAAVPTAALPRPLRW